MQPETRYARLGDLHLAYQVLGEGPPDILLLDQWFSHVEAQWDVPPLARPPRTAGVVRPPDHVRQARHRACPTRADVRPADDRGVDGRRSGRPRRGRLGAGRRDHEHRRRDHRDPVRRRPSGARLEPRPRRLLRPVPGGGPTSRSVPRRRPSAQRSRRPRRGPGAASCSTCSHRASRATSACDAPGHATSARPRAPGTPSRSSG